jgi:hypothetical protein
MAKLVYTDLVELMVNHLRQRHTALAAMHQLHHTALAAAGVVVTKHRLMIAQVVKVVGVKLVHF